MKFLWEKRFKSKKEKDFLKKKKEEEVTVQRFRSDCTEVQKYKGNTPLRILNFDG